MSAGQLSGNTVETAEQVMNILQDASKMSKITAAVVLVVMLILSHFIIRIVGKALTNGKRVPPSAHKLVIFLVRTLLIMLSLMAAANILGIPVNPFLALFSVVGVAISLAVQDFLSNLVGCLAIATSREFKLGDFIQTPTASGKVMHVSLLSTKLRTASGLTVFVPNKTILSSPLTNYTASEKQRIQMTYTAAHRHPVEEVKEALQEAVSQMDTLLPDSTSSVVVAGITHICVNYEVYVWAAGKDCFDTLYRMNELVHGIFMRRGIDWVNPGTVMISEKK